MLNLVLTHGIPPAYRDGVYIYANRHRVNPIALYQVMQLRTDGVHCRESPRTGPVVLKVVPVTGTAFSGFTMDQFFMRLSFSYIYNQY